MSDTATPGPPIDSLERPRLADIVARQLSGMIEDGTLRPGDTLPSEGELARRFGVSKATIREAVQQLSALGAMEVRQGKPSSVRKPSYEALERVFSIAVAADPDGLRNLMELRRALETQTVVLAARRIDAAGLAELRRLVSILEANKTNDAVWTPTHTEFHLALMRAARNRAAAHLLQAMRDVIGRSARIVRSAPIDPTFDATFRRHLAIVEAVAARDEIGARDAMERHFDAVDRVIDSMGRRPGEVS